MKYLYTIEEQYVVEDCVGVKKNGIVLLKGTNRKQAIKEASRIFKENKPEDYKLENYEKLLMIAEKYYSKYGELHKYVVLIKMERLDF